MSSPSMVATTAREALIDKVVDDIRSLLLHGFIPPEDGGNSDEALFNCLLACQGASPVAISLADLFEGQEGSIGSSEASSGAGRMTDGASDRRLVCHLLKLALRRRQLTQLLRNFSTNEEVLGMWYAETSFIRHSAHCGSLLLLVRAIETGRPGLLSCLLTRPPFVEGMFSNYRDQAGSIEQAVEVTPDMDIDEFDDFDDTFEPSIEHLSSSLKETMQSLMSFFTSGFGSQSGSSEEGEANIRVGISLSPSSTRSAPIPTPRRGSQKQSRRPSLLSHTDPLASPRDENGVIYHTLSASDLHLSRLCVQPDLQPEHLFHSAAKEVATEAPESTSDFEAMTAAVFPLSESPVSQRLSTIVSDISQRVGSRSHEDSVSRQRRHSIQMFLAESECDDPPSCAVAATESVVASSLPVFHVPEEDIQLPSLSELRQRGAETLSDGETSLGAGKEALALTLSTSPDRRASRALRLAEGTSSAATMPTAGRPSRAAASALLGHRRVFSDGLPAEVLAQVAMNRSTSSLPIGAPRPMTMSTVTTDSDSTSCQTCPSMSDASDVPTFAIGPTFEPDGHPPDPMAALETCQVPGRITRTLYAALNFNINLENSRLLFVLDDLYAKGLCELETARRMAHFRRRLHYLTPGFGHCELGEAEAVERPLWASRQAEEDARLAGDAVCCAGEGAEVYGAPPPAPVRDPLFGEASTAAEPAGDGVEEVLAMLPAEDPVRCSQSLRRLLAICLRAPDLHEEHSPTNLAAKRLALMSADASQLLDEASSISSSRAIQLRRFSRPDSSDYLGSVRRLAKGAFSHNDAFLPPALEIPSDIYSKKYRADQFLAQRNRCAGCGQASPPHIAKRFRFCEFFGHFFCEYCHNGESGMNIPARVLKNWDFSVYPVSMPAAEFLKRLFPRPVFRPPRSLLNRIRPLREFELLRKQLSRFMPFLNTCRMAGGVRAALNDNSEGQRYTWPRHWLWREECRLPLYSMQDFTRLRWGRASEDLRAILRSCVEHVSLCPLCQAKGFICELCGLGKAIFPFEVHTTHQCPECGACFHLECWVTYPEGGASVCCPRCTRLEARQRQRAAGPGADEEATEEEEEVTPGCSPAVEAR